MLQSVTARGAYKIVYCSRNCLQGQVGGAEEIERILRKSRDNNRRAGVSGALLYNDGCFAQVLEGEQGAVEAIYERIACDPRHRDITMLEAGLGGARDFGDWSMAYTGAVTDDARPMVCNTLNAAFTGRGVASDAVLALLRRVVLAESVAA